MGQVPFKGCLRDLTYNFRYVNFKKIIIIYQICLGLFCRAIPFLNEELSNYTTPDGVTFNSCPFVPERRVSLVGLFQKEPEVR